jgi:hypothetical protein
MLINLAALPPCEQTSMCGLARACIDGVCNACRMDSDCEAEEACVLDHCLRRNLVSCRSRRNCHPGETCVLSGFSADLRGNREMYSKCIGNTGGAEKAKAPALAPDQPGREVQYDDERRRAREFAP